MNSCGSAVRHNTACFGCLDLIYVTCQVCRECRRISIIGALAFCCRVGKNLIGILGSPHLFIVQTKQILKGNIWSGKKWMDLLDAELGILSVPGRWCLLLIYYQAFGFNGG